MSNTAKIHLNGSLIARLIGGLGKTQKEISEQALLLKKQHPETHAKALRLSQPVLTKIIKAQPSNIQYYWQHLETALLLAEVLGVAVDSLYDANERRGAADEQNNIYEQANNSQLPLSSPYLHTQTPILPNKSDAADFGHLTDLPFVDLPFTPIHARASFAEMCGRQSDYGAEETVRYILPPRPLTEYMKNKSRVFEVNGDSMEPEIRSGEKIVADPVPEGRWELLHNEVVVISYDNVVTVRYIKENELLNRGILTLHPREGLAPLSVRRSLIHCIYVVRESFERKIFS